MRIILTGAFLLLLTGVLPEKCTGTPPGTPLPHFDKLSVAQAHFGHLNAVQCDAQNFPKKDSTFASKLPLVIINTGNKKIRDNKKTNAGMGIIYKGAGFYNRVSDPFNQYTGDIRIEVRGSSSKRFPKKSYSVQTVDEAGRSRYVSLLGLQSECDWILYAPYNDKTLMRDALAYRMFREMDRYATNTIYVELILNGRYQGVYILEEKIKRSPVRVNLNTSSKNRSSVFDGFILRIDKPRDGSWLLDGRTLTRIIAKSRKILMNKKEPKSNGKKPNICSESKSVYFKSSYAPTGSKWQIVKFNYYDPKPEELTLKDRLDICNFMHLAETSLHDPFTMSKDSGYHKYIDMESFVDFFIINEVTKNMDGYRLSTYFYKSSESNRGKISLGPPWDYNISMGNVDYCEGYLPTGWAYEYNKICPNDAYLVPFWWERLMDDPLFRDHLKCRWNSLRKSSLSTDNVLYVIDSISNVLNDSPHRNFKRWKVLGKDIWPNKYVFKSYLEEVAYLKNWLTERLEWLDRNMPGNCPALKQTDVGNKF